MKQQQSKSNFQTESKIMLSIFQVIFEEYILVQTIIQEHCKPILISNSVVLTLNYFPYILETILIYLFVNIERQVRTE